MAGRIARTYGEAFRNSSVDGLTHVFPAPEKLARARFNNIGLTKSRAETIRRVARAVIGGDVSFDTSQDPEDFRDSMLAIRGIGDWTAQYIAMRALKNPDAFPASDLGLLRAFDDEYGERLRPAALEQLSQSWRPWRAYAALLLWSSAPRSGG